MSETQTEQQPELINQFVDYLRNERHFSPYTARCYGADLRQYVEYLESPNAAQAEIAGVTAEMDGPSNDPIAIGDKLKQADPMVVRGFLSHLDQFGYSPATTARKIATLRSFYKWMNKRGIIESNPMLLIRTPKQTKRLPKAITVEQVEQLLQPPTTVKPLVPGTVRSWKPCTPPVSASASWST